MTPPRLLRRTFLALLLAAAAADVLVVACGGSRPAAAPARGEPAAAGGVHVLDLLPRATVRGDLRGLGGDPDRAGPVVFGDAFTQPPAFPWFDGAWYGELAQAPAAPRRARAAAIALDGASGSRDGRGVSLAADDVGLHAIVAAPPDASFLVHARVRAPTGSSGGSLAAMSLPGRPPADDAALAARLPKVTDEERAAERSEPLPSDGRGEWRDLCLFVGPREGRGSLGLSILPSDRGLDVDLVELRRLDLAAVLRWTPRLGGDAATHPLRRMVACGLATADALLVPSGAEVELAVDVPKERPRLRFVPGALAARAGARVAIAVRVDGVERLGRELSAATLDGDAPLAPVEVDLASEAGRRVTLAFSARALDAGEECVAWFGAPELLGAREGPRKRNLLLVSLDTTRADLLGCYGSEAGLTPNLDAFAAQGLRFEEVISPSSWTLPTHMSLFTGQHPILHGMIAHPRVMDPVRSRPLAARMREQGWCTAAFTAGGPLEPNHGFGHGFDWYTTADPLGLTKYNHAAPDVVAARASSTDPLAPTLEWLSAHADQPFLLFVHTFFVHNYFPHREWLARHADPDAKIIGDLPLEMGELAMKGDATALARVKALYAAGLQETDATLIPRLLRALDELKLADDTIVCIFADHGEEHLEHGQFGHRLELYRESTRVPWLMRGPGVPGGAVRRGRVDLADMSATLASLLALPAEPLDFSRDLLAPGADAADEPPHLLVFNELGEPGGREALEVGPWKLMRWRLEGGATRLALYRTDVDPLETKDLAAEQPERARALEAQLDATIADYVKQAGELPGSNVLTRDLTPAELERLRGLGYAGH